jgi:hypothetical protein
MVLGSGIRDPGSGKNPFRIPDPGVKIGTGSRIRIRNTETEEQFLRISGILVLCGSVPLTHGSGSC